MTNCGAKKSVWVTGAGKGIGRALSRRLSQDGWLVHACARTMTDLESLSAECPAGRIIPHVLDITDEAATRAVLSAIENQSGVPDLAVLNAGTHLPNLAAELKIKPFRDLMETNYMGTVSGLVLIQERMRAQGKGHIAVVSSLAGYRGLPGASAYGASKAALINMCEALKPELEMLGIKLQLVNPGFVETPLTDKNNFKMPFLIPVETAVNHIMHGLSGNNFEITFPWKFAILMKILRILPDPVFFAITRRMVRL